MARLRGEIMVAEKQLAALQQIADEEEVTITSQPYAIPEPRFYVCVLSDKPNIDDFWRRVREPWSCKGE